MTAVRALTPLWRQVRDLRWSASDLLKGLKLTTPPVPVREIAEHLGIVVRFEPLTGYDGSMTFEAGAPVIRVQATDAQTRQRFTIAHEIAHLMLHEGTQHRDLTFAGNPVEVEANRYAAELLMPFFMLQPFVERVGTNQHVLASVFNVSPQAMAIRLEMMVGLR